MGESTNREPGNVPPSIQLPQELEQVLAAIALLLGPDTNYYKRQCATQYLAKLGPEILPLLLRALQDHHEITTPSWPWWPPQYGQISRLLIQLSQEARVSLEKLLHYSTSQQMPGPVLWTSIIEAAGLLPHLEYEPLLRAGLRAPWWTTRYAAATAIAHRASHVSLCTETREALSECQRSDSETSVRLVAACTLFRCSDESGLETLMNFLNPAVHSQFRKAALFILATESSMPLTRKQKQSLTELLLLALRDEDQQIALHAARALRTIATPDVLPDLKTLLEDDSSRVCLAALTALEELASRKTMRYAIQQQLIPQQIAALLRKKDPETHRQTCYTLATVGGEYARAILGILILNSQHPAHLEAIEALRLLPDVQHPPIMTRAMHWLLHALTETSENVQACALDSLNHLVWQARIQRRNSALHTIKREMEQSNIIFQLLASASAWVRQRTIELLAMFNSQLFNQRVILLKMLHYDTDSNVRACIAHALGQEADLWAIPDLLLALLDSDEFVAETALKALDALPMPDDALIVFAMKELACYQLPTSNLKERHHLINTARLLLKKRIQAQRQ